MRSSVVVLACCMLLTGTINTIATKYQDIIVIGTAPDGTPLTFRHPAVQSAAMFLGESLCLIPYFIMRWRRRRAKRRDPAYVPMAPADKRSRRLGRILAFAVPTLCDATGTSLMNIGLFYTYASTYQMLRGTLVLFAGAFTVLILRRQLFIHHWLGMVLITAGAALVGASSVIYQDAPPDANIVAPWQLAAGAHGSGGWNASAAPGLHYAPGVSRLASRGMLSAAALGGRAQQQQPPHHSSGGRLDLATASAAASASAAPLFGDLLVVCAQAFTALQFILEERYLVRYKVPALLAVGLEGCWGLVLCSLLLPVTSIIKGSDGLPVDDALAALRAIAGNAQLAGAVVLSVFSIAFFNFFGVSVTKSLSGAARATIDAVRTLFIWLYALHAGWESFHALEVVGFVVLISGTSLYNELIKSCLPGGPTADQRPPSQQQSRRRTRTSQQRGDTKAGLATPLLSGGSSEPDLAAAAAAVSSGGISSGRGRRASPVLLGRPAPAHARPRTGGSGDGGDGGDGGGYDASGGGGSWAYHMARSMRLGIHTLSPQSLAAPGGLAEEEGDDDEETGSGSESCTSSSYYSSCLASSLSRGSLDNMGSSGAGTSGALAAAAAGAGVRSPSPALLAGQQQQQAVVGLGGSGMRVLRGFAAAPPNSVGAAGLPGGGGSSRRSGGGTGAGSSGVGGLTASLAAAAAAPGSARTPPLPRSSSGGSVRRQASGTNLRHSGDQQRQQQQPPPQS